MKKGFFQSLRFRILLVVLTAMVPFIALSVYQAQEDRNRENKDLRDEAIQLVNFTLIEEVQTIDGARQVLISLSSLPKEYLANPDWCKKYLSVLLKRYKRYVNLGVVNKNGILFASGRQIENKIDYSTNEFFEEVMQNGEFSVGEYFVDPISHKRIINLGYPILDEKQRIKAVLFASLDVSYIDLIEKDLAKIFHEKSLFIKIDNEGDIIATNSDSVEQIKSILTPTFLSSVSEQETGIVEAPGPNNQKYLFVFATTQSNLFQQKLRLIVGVNKEKFFAEINKTLYRNLFLIGALFAIILASVLILSDKYILKTVKKLINATNEMSTGNLSIRSNVGYSSGELGQLAMTFDRMAESLESQRNERQKIECTLRESEERFRNLFENSPVSLWWEDHSEIKKRIDKHRAAGIEDFKTYFQIHPEEVANCVTMLKVIAVNEATLQLYEAKNKEDLLKGLVKIFRKESYRVFTEELIALTTGKTVFECEASTQTLTGKRNYVIFKLLILPGYEETWSKVLVSMTDITERKKVEEERSKLFAEVQEAGNQLRSLSRRLLETQETERKNISRELHDEIGQTLTAVKINLQSIQKTNKSNKIRKELDVPISYITQSLQQVRDISLNLRPSVLDDLGIESALKWLINRFVQSTKIKFDLQFVTAEIIPSKELELTCYRITQEALTNIVKYADAKNVVVCLSNKDKSLHLKITDDGKGFDVKDARSQALKGKSLGILSMEERAKLAGGEFKIISSKKSGTEVLAIFHLT